MTLGHPHFLIMFYDYFGMLLSPDPGDLSAVKVFNIIIIVKAYNRFNKVLLLLSCPSFIVDS